MEQVAVIIPVKTPGSFPVQYVEKLLQSGFPHIIVVNDGVQQPEHFDAITQMGVHVLQQEGAAGKGDALKTGFRYYLNHLADQCIGVITADCDRQYSPSDVAKVAEQMPGSGLVLGTADCPGSRLPSALFSLLYSKRISDALTGLRGIANQHLPTLLGLQEKGVAFDIRMLISAAMERWSIVQCPIQAKPEQKPLAVRESVKIYHVLLGCFCRFLASSALSSLLDIALFALFTKLIFRRLDVVVATLWGTAIARVISSLANYIANKKLVFQHDDPSPACFYRFVLMCIVQSFASWLLIVTLNRLVHWDTTLLKVIVDCTLFCLSYRVQQVWVFRRESTK